MSHVTVAATGEKRQSYRQSPSQMMLEPLTAEVGVPDISPVTGSSESPFGSLHWPTLYFPLTAARS
jgi:hypothetical protein